MKALVLDQNKSLSIKEVQLPRAGVGEVLVKLESAALNHRDIWITKGLYPGMTLPCVLGADGSGVIVSVGTGVSEDNINREVIIYPGYDWGEKDQKPLRSFRVLGMPDPGTFAEYIAVPFENIIDKPTHLSWEESAALPLTFLTAWRALVYHGAINKSTRLLITGIGGGVAQAGMAIAKAIGSEIYVTSSSAEKINHAIAKGAVAGVNYKEENWYELLKEKSGGIDIVLDSSPSEKLDNYLKFLNYGAKIVYYGSTGSRFTNLNLSKFFLRHIQLIGTAMGSLKQFDEVVEFVKHHKVIPEMDSVYSLEEAKIAMDHLATGRQTGKIVIKI